MLKVKIISVGKHHQGWLQEALSEYEKRISYALNIEWILSKTEEQFEKILRQESFYIGLDPGGKLLTSEQFSALFFKEFEVRGSRLTLAIGGALGFSAESRKKAAWLLSLSPMVFTHQITRLILLEQLYRALEIQKGSSYHKA